MCPQICTDIPLNLPQTTLGVSTSRVNQDKVIKIWKLKKKLAEVECCSQEIWNHDFCIKVCT